MSNVITISVAGNNTSEFAGKLVLTNYGISRLADKIVRAENFTPLNLCKIGIGDRGSYNYDRNVNNLKREVLSVSFNKENMVIDNGILTISKDIDIPSDVNLQEIGIFEEVNGEFKLFAYASGFSVIKPSTIKYTLVIKLALKLGFKNEHYSKFEKTLETPEYASRVDIEELQAMILGIETDLERCITHNAKKLGYNKAELFYKEQVKMADCLQNSLLFGRYLKLLSKVDTSDMTDCFIFPASSESKVYTIKNLQDETSSMEVINHMKITNHDNIDLRNPTSIVYIATMNNFEIDGPILGKMNPDKDEYYFDIRWSVKENLRRRTPQDPKYIRSLVFSLYSYAKELEYDVSRGKVDERKMVGHYRVIYTPSEDKLSELMGKETTFSFLYNGDIENPHVDFYLNEELITDVVIDNFNYFGPCDAFRTSCTLRNYSQTVSSISFEDPDIYVLKDVNISEIFMFKGLISPETIKYLSLISQS